jgi:hypothetical protein
MAGLVSRNWNTIYPSLCLMHKKLQELGVYRDSEGKVSFIELPLEKNDA